MISTVDSVDKEMRRDGKHVHLQCYGKVIMASTHIGIFCHESLIQALKGQWFDPHCFSVQNKVRTVYSLCLCTI